MGDERLSPSQFGVAFKEFMDAMVASAAPRTNPLLERIEAHLGTRPAQLPVIAEEIDPFEHPNLQVALDAYLKGQAREATLIGVAAENKRFMALSLSDLASSAGGFGRTALAEGPVDHVNFHLAGERTLSCVQFGVYLIRNETGPLVALVVGPSERMGPRPRLRLEVMAPRREDAQAFLAEISGNMRRLNVYRGHVISLSPGQIGMGPQTLVAFHTMPTVTRDDVVLPTGILERIERHTVVFAEHADRLLAAGRSLRRGLLLYGLPGTGKTLTVMYLRHRMPDRTVILVTGRGMGLIQTVAEMARVLAPSMVVLEDVDLIAEERGNPLGRTGPLLFELLNEMDGLRNENDVIFVLTTNRPDILEPALAARPGRIDLAVELPLPDADGRRQLLELYARGLDLQDVDLTAVAEEIDGATPAYIKELLRKAVLLATENGNLIVTRAHLTTAVAELNEGGRLAQRMAGFRPEQIETALPPRPPRPTGFPAVRMPRNNPSPGPSPEKGGE